MGAVMRPSIKLPKKKVHKKVQSRRPSIKGARAKPKKVDPYMSKVVNLLDVSGMFLFRGTRRECLEFSRATYQERLLEQLAMKTGA